MTAHRVNENDIVDVLLGQASSEVEEQVRKRRQSDRRFADLYKEWDGHLKVAHEEKARIEILRENTHRRVMEQLEIRSSSSVVAAQDRWGVSRSRKEIWAQNLADLTLSWERGGIAVLVIAAFVVFGVTGAVLLNDAASPDMAANDEPAEVRYVQLTGSSGEAPGTESEPFGTIRDGVFFTPPGGVLRIASGQFPETLRITKALTLTSSGGTVRIGPQYADTNNQ